MPKYIENNSVQDSSVMVFSNLEIKAAIRLYLTQNMQTKYPTTVEFEFEDGVISAHVKLRNIDE